MHKPSLKFNKRNNKWMLVLAVLAIQFANPWLTLVSFMIFLTFGIGIGLHRIACHKVEVNKPFERLCFALGLLTHSGSLRGSAVQHAQHHKFADTEQDHHKLGRTVKAGSFLDFLSKKEIKEALKGFDDTAMWMDLNYYRWTLPLWVISLALFPSVFVGAIGAMFFHDYIAVNVLHTRFGYRNYNTPDKSVNIWWLWPIMLGENWHNNHHGKVSNDYGDRWWEVDVLALICKWQKRGS
jgi:fatty-acid desaturase